MRLLFVADGRSPIALNWIRYFVEADHEVHLISSYPCGPSLGLASLTVAPVAFSGLGKQGSGEARGSFLGGTRMIKVRTKLRNWLGPSTIPIAARRVRRIIEHIEPDLVHAMRIPFEGMLAAAADPSVPLLVSVWGNDFTLHAPSSAGMRKYTRETLGRADGLHADCARDLILAQEWGYPKDGVAYVFPGNGGVRSEYFHQREGNELGDSALKELLLEIPPDRPVIVNPRGFRAYIRNDTFFKAIPGILEARPGAVFLCPAMKGVRQASEWVRKLGVEQSVRLLPTLNPAEMGAVFRRSQVAVSLAEHDGTPNTLLEAMACGSFPVASDLESIREWIEEAVNGFLVDPGSPGEVCEAVLRALEDSWIRDRASGHNTQIIAERATFSRIMPRMESNYDKLARIPPREAR